MNVSLGGLIKTYRINRRLSQFDVATAIGWKDTSRLSKIEQEHEIQPSREIVERLSKALFLSNREKSVLLWVGGYLPTDVEIENIKTEVSSLINNWKYPAYLTDFSWRLLGFNEHAREVYKMSKKDISFVTKNKVNILEMFFNPEYQKMMPVELVKGGMSGVNLLRRQVALFKLDNEKFANLGWYKSLVKKLMPLPYFREVWISTTSDILVDKVANYETKVITLEPGNPKTRLSFDMFITPVVADIRFQISFYNPRDAKTANFYSDK